jgi:hypothetical protein
MKTKTSDLTLLALDWAVVRCECDIPAQFKSIPALLNGTVRVFRGDTSNYSGPVSPSTNWAQGGPIIEREKIRLNCGDGTWGVAEGVWEAAHPRNIYVSFGPTPLVAAMRCYVASKLGDTVDIPEGLQ